MKIVYWGKGERAKQCLEALLDNGYNIMAIVVHLEENKQSSFRMLAKESGIETFALENPNTEQSVARLASLGADLFVLGGYGKILRKNVLNVPKLFSVNLHGGKVPEYRGSSPLNWALINGEKSFGLSVLEVDLGIDSGPVLCSREFPISTEDTIVDLHAIANREFPEMLLEVMKKISEGNLVKKPQDEELAGYYPLRFPEDGLVFFDQFNVIDVYNRIRALTEPFPCAYTYWNGKKVKLIAAELCEPPFHGEPGRIYRKRKGKLLVGCKGGCLWITQAIIEVSQKSLYDTVSVYDLLDTVASNLEKYLLQKDEN